MSSDVIPIDLLRHHILVRVPAEALLRFRSVCKAWRDMIDEPPFAKSHLQHQISRGPDRLVIVPKKTGNFLPFYSLASISSNDSITHSRTFYYDKLPMPTCNGLLLLDESGVLWNPFTGDSHMLPPLPHDDLMTEFSICSGVGYDSSTDDYKVVLMFGRFTLFKSYIYSLKLNSWKRGIDFTFANCSPVFSRQNLSVFCNGTLYWRFYKSHECIGIIVALDLCTENYRLLELPLAASEVNSCDYSLGVLAGEYLCVSWSSNIYYGTPRFHVWVVIDSGGHNNTWTNMLSIDHDQVMQVSVMMIDGNMPVESMRPIAYVKSSKRLLIGASNCFGEELLWYDVEKKCWDNTIQVIRPTDRSSYQLIYENLLRLGDASKQTLKRKRNNTSNTSSSTNKCFCQCHS